MSNSEEAKLDKEIEVFNTIVTVLGTIDEASRPRILGASAIIHGIEELPIASIVSRPV